MQTAPRTAVLAYPEIQDADRAWIESVRRVEDPQFDTVRPHFTLAFPSQVAAPGAVLHASSVARAFSPIDFVLDATRAVPDRVHGGCHVFLVPSAGAPEIEALHRALYDGPFGPHRLPGVPFIPHLTVGAHPAETDSQALIARLEGKVPEIRGRILEIDVVEAWPRETPSVRTIPLSSVSS